MKKSTMVSEFIEGIDSSYLIDEFSNNSNRVKELTKSACGLRIDFSKQLWNLSIAEELIDFTSKQSSLKHQIDRFFNGDKINVSEDRSVKHYLLRAPANSYPDDELKQVIVQRENFLNFAQKIYENGNFQYIVNIGIGGSDLGPLMAHQALSPSIKKAYFVSNVDPKELDQVLAEIDPTKTIFIVVSKTFTTKETLLNATRARNKVASEFGEQFVADHFVAVSTNISACVEFGISEKNIFGFWDWVGGRYSVSSAVGISLAMCYGKSTFNQLLNGMHDFDTHFRKSDLKDNLAIWHAMSCIYNINYLGLTTQAIIPYSSNLKEFPSYLQQLIMESNGKSITNEEKLVDHKTAPIIFGAAGTNSQHSFFQSLHQGTTVIPTDFIVIKPESSNTADISLVANALAQAAVLAFGEKDNSSIPMAKRMPANRPSNLIMMDKLDAYHLGVLISFYEASTIVQGFCWGINSFDQWGVQLGKVVAETIEESIKNKNYKNIDMSTQAAMEHLF